MFFWFKKKEIVLDCFTHSGIAYQYAKPDFAYKFFPEWFLKLPKTIKDEHGKIQAPTIKRCQGFKRYYTANTIIIPSPFHFLLNIGSIDEKGYSWEINYPESVIGQHPLEQYQGLTSDNYQHLKIHVPWEFKTNKFVEFIWSDPVWNRSNLLDYIVLPGITDYKYQNTAHVNMFAEYRDVPRQLVFTLGQPLAHLTPLSDCNLTIKYHQISAEEMDRHGFISSKSSSFDGKPRYVTNKLVIQAAEKRDAIKRCPFHLR